MKRSLKDIFFLKTASDNNMGGAVSNDDVLLPRLHP